MTTTLPTAVATREVDPAQVKRWLQEGTAILVDVREPSEHRAERISGSRPVPLSAFDVNAVPREPGKTTVLHCKAGRRSMTALGKLEAAGVTGAVSMTGGIDAWKAAGLPTQVDKSAPIDVMRQTQITIGSLVLTGLALGYFVSPWGLLLSAMMGAGLVVAGSTGHCGLAMLMAKMPWNRAACAK